MSSDEFHKGRLKELKNLRGKLSNNCLEELKKLDPNLYYDEDDDYFDSDIIFKVKDRYFQLFDHNEIKDDSYHSNMSKNEDGTYSFSTLFYNGGTCLSEELEEMIHKQLEEE